MADEWDQFPDDPWSEFPDAQEPYSGAILPFSKDAQGNVSFDSNAGILGAIKRVVEFPAEAMRGNIDPLSDEGIARAAETGLMFSPLSAASRGGLGWAGAAKGQARKPPVPTAEQLESTAGFGFNMARKMDVRYDPVAVQEMVDTVRARLHADGFRRSNAKKVFSELDNLARPAEPGAFASIDDLHSVRMALSRAARPLADGSNADEAAAAARIIDAIDGFITKPDPSSVVAGPAAAAGNVWKDAVKNYAAGKRSDRLMGIEESTLRRAKANNSGLNIDNTIRQRVASVLDSPAKRRGFSPEEIGLLEEVANGTATRNTLRWAGNILGGGGGVAGGIAGGAGFAAFGLPGTVAAIGAPLAAKLGGNKLTKNALRRVDTATRKRSPLYQQSPMLPGKTPANPTITALPGRAAVAEALAARDGDPTAPQPVNPGVGAVIDALIAPQRPPGFYDPASPAYGPRQVY